jgi:hypothetical protein
MIKEVNFKDRESVNLSDSFGDRKKDGRGPIGRVKIFERRVEGTDKVLYLVGQSPNLIVYHGRNWLMQRAFAQDLSGFTNWNTYKLGWFAIGTGAAVANPLSPTAPALSNIALATHGVIGSGTNYVTVGGRQYHVLDSITYEEDDEVTTYSGSDNYLVAKVTTTLATNEANNDSGASGYSGYEYYQDINEAGLFFSDYKTISPAPTVMQMFARVTFPTIRKTNTTELVFNWYIYF